MMNCGYGFCHKSWIVDMAFVQNKKNQRIVAGRTSSFPSSMSPMAVKFKEGKFLYFKTRFGQEKTILQNLNLAFRLKTSIKIKTQTATEKVEVRLQTKY